MAMSAHAATAAAAGSQSAVQVDQAADFDVATRSVALPWPAALHLEFGHSHDHAIEALVETDLAGQA